MEVQKLGESGLSISRVIVGCMTFGKKSYTDWFIEDKDRVFSILKKCYDSGLRTFDTADVYSNGESEILLGKFIKKYKIPRNKVVILSKCYFPTEHENPHFNSKSVAKAPAYEYANNQGSSRKHIFDAIQGSVERLGTYVDVLQIHRLDKSTPKREIMKALNDVVEQGLARYIGASAMKAIEFAQLQFIADKNGWFKFISMQNYYNLTYREEENEMIPFCNDSEFGKVGIIPYSPLAKGILTRPLGQKSQNNRTSDTDALQKYYGLSELIDSDKEIVNRVEELAKKYKVNMASVATAWLLIKGACPIVGITSEERVDDYVEACKLKLTKEDTKFLEEPYVTKPAHLFFVL
ncbi:putative aryl-alcohol dehydrogenase Aad16p [[Candida] railenensis]|uniref:Aryl-alcohol dehydrogenase Aad16p n=1 Tax=[Candida] railenensis TaxID=45579 RepID=A0A9P0QWF7_9ASCO|nr:putative aryl-alcohol dehydrogenase Aad16p [[Candida] railenensis]